MSNNYRNFPSVPLLQETSHYPSLSSVEESGLAQAARTGDTTATDRLIVCNIRLVASIARRYAGFGIPLDDLVAEGLIGLTKAVGKFDPQRAKLSTFAVWWIRHSILSALARQARLVRLPAYLVTRLSKINQATEYLTQELGREPTTEEIAQQTGLAPRKVGEALANQRLPVSLDEVLPSDSSESHTLGDLIRDQHAQDPSAQLDTTDNVQQLRSLLSSRGVLTQREEQILTRRFGIGTDIPEPFQDIADDLDLTAERVRQLHHGAILKLRRKLAELPAVANHY